MLVQSLQPSSLEVSELGGSDKQDDRGRSDCTSGAELKNVSAYEVSGNVDASGFTETLVVSGPVVVKSKVGFVASVKGEVCCEVVWL